MDPPASGPSRDTSPASSFNHLPRRSQRRERADSEPIARRTYSERRREILECRPPKGRKKFRPGAISWGRRRVEDEPSRSPDSATIPSPQCTLRSQCGRLGACPGFGLAGLDWLR